MHAYIYKYVETDKQAGRQKDGQSQGNLKQMEMLLNSNVVLESNVNTIVNRVGSLNI